MSEHACGEPRRKPRPGFLGELCIRYVNYMARKHDSAFEEIAIASTDFKAPADAPEIQMRCLLECGGIPELLKVYNETYVGSVDFRRAGWIEAMALKACSSFDPGLAWIAYLDGEPVGFSMARCCDGIGRLTGIGVSQNCRNQGIGHAVVSRTLRHLLDAGARTVVATVEHGNNRIASIYQDIGFQRV